MSNQNRDNEPDDYREENLQIMLGFVAFLIIIIILILVFGIGFLPANIIP